VPTFDSKQLQTRSEQCGGDDGGGGCGGLECLAGPETHTHKYTHTPYLVLLIGLQLDEETKGYGTTGLSHFPLERSLMFALNTPSLSLTGT
jgi:hypothetical protein